MELKDKTVLVIGLGRTGREAARFLVHQGARVLLNDLRPETELRAEIDSLERLPIEYRLGHEQAARLEEVDMVVPSPGVPRESPLLQKALLLHRPVLSEIELAYRFFQAPLIAITGTNGKSTTTTLIGEILTAAKKKVFIGGNLGVPFISAVSQLWEWGVLEISSFQLEWIEHFRPRIAVLLNLTEDHLDRYASFAEYGATKERIFAAQTAEDTAILNRDDRQVWEMRGRIKSRIVSFGVAEVVEGVFVSGDAIIWRGDGAEERFSLKHAKIHGRHNLENMMAAVAAAKCSGVPREAIQTVLTSFPGLEHRLEFVRQKDGVRYYNDSKGTNVGAVVKSLASFTEPVVLLAGGVDKGGSYAPLADAVKRKVRRLVLFGAAKEIIAAALGTFTETVLVEDLAAAVKDAGLHARPGDVVLLSPACSSFDQFRNYAERGKTYKALVRNL